MDKGAISSTESALICCALLIAVSSFTLGIPTYFYRSPRFIVHFVESYVSRELWVPEIWTQYVQEEEEKERIKMAESGKV